MSPPSPATHHPSPQAAGEASRSLLDLSGRAALVTGASGEIGAAIARMLAAHGASVAVHCARAREAAQRVVDEVTAAGGRGLVVQADVTSARDVAAMAERGLEAFGRIDILVNNAGVRRKTGDHKYLLDVTEEEWDLEMASHLKGAFLCSKAFVPGMIANGWGRIVNISSVVAHTGQIGASVHYPAAKAGMFGYSRALANQLAGKGITVNVVAPGMIDSERIRWRTPEQMKEHVAKIPLGRVGTTDEVAFAVLFLASPLAGYITGATLDVNGGLRMA